MLLVRALIGEAIHLLIPPAGYTRFQFLDPAGSVRLVLVALAAILLRPSGIRLIIPAVGMGGGVLCFGNWSRGGGTSSGSPGVCAKAGLLELADQVGETFPQPVRKIGIGSPHRDVDFIRLLRKPDFYAVAVGAWQLNREAPQRLDRLRPFLHFRSGYLRFGHIGNRAVKPMSGLGLRYERRSPQPDARAAERRYLVLRGSSSMSAFFGTAGTVGLGYDMGIGITGRRSNRTRGLNTGSKGQFRRRLARRCNSKENWFRQFVPAVFLIAVRAKARQASPQLPAPG